MVSGVFLVVTFLVAPLFFGIYGVANAQAGGVTATCPCCGIPKKCPQPCPPCVALNCQGICLPGPGIPEQCDVIPGTCKNQPEKGSAGGAEKAMEMAKQLMDALKGKAGGGGGASDFATTSDFERPAQANFDAASLGVVGGESPLASFTQTAADRVSSAAANLFSNIFGGGDEVPPPPDQKAGAQQSAETKTDAEAGVRGTRPGGAPARDADEPPFQAPREEGGIAGFFSRFFDIDEQRSRVAEGQSFFRRLCASRPWQATFVARVFSAGFFDSLCAEQGRSAEDGDQFIFDPSNSQARYARLVCPTKVKVGEGATVAWDCGGSQSAGFGFDTGGRAAGSVTMYPEDINDYFLRCGNGGRAQCTIDVERPRAQITAYPAHVQLGARSEVFWTSENSVECTIEGPGFKELGTRGAATTPVILNIVTYTITCSSEDGLQARDSVEIRVGNN